METQKHLAVLRKVALVVLGVGVLDLAVSCYRLSTASVSGQINLSLNIVMAVFVAFYLWRGGLRMASVVRWLSVLALATIAATLLTAPFLQPIGLTLLQMRLETSAFFYPLLVLGFSVVFLLWLARTLGDESILAARAAAGYKRRDMRIPAAIGAGLVLLFSGLYFTFMGGPDAERAIALARDQVGKDYRFQVRAINIMHTPQGRQGFASVTVWNDKEIKTVPVYWKEEAAR
ncbi:hypothetical protein [Chitinimonas lacunae]|uniref:Uncharacterized protein n=1 Tax=Chitinimonas lacunae TaxID=1963018 RepID=A0ABV8MND7_9NEIS